MIEEFYVIPDKLQSIFSTLISFLRRILCPKEGRTGAITILNEGSENAYNIHVAGVNNTVVVALPFDEIDIPNNARGEK